MVRDCVYESFPEFSLCIVDGFSLLTVLSSLRDRLPLPWPLLVLRCWLIGRVRAGGVRGFVDVFDDFERLWIYSSAISLVSLPITDGVTVLIESTLGLRCLLSGVVLFPIPFGDLFLDDFDVVAAAAVVVVALVVVVDCLVCLVGAV